MKKIISVIVTLFLLQFTGCLRCGDLTITGISIRSEKIQTTGNNSLFYEPTDIFSEADIMVFQVDSDTDYHSHNINYTPLIDRCYGTSCMEDINNPLVPSTARLYFDKPFVYRGDEIEAGINILAIESILKEIRTLGGSNDVTNFRILLNETFLKDAIFELHEPYVVTVSCQTMRDELFIANTTIFFMREPTPLQSGLSTS